MPATSSTYVQHALWNYPSHALREQKTKLLTARGPGSTVCTASLRKSAEPAYWPRRVPALGQRCARARESGLQDCCMHDADYANLPKHTLTGPKMLQDPRKGAIRAGDPDMRHHPGDILGGSGGRARDAGENGSWYGNQTIKCRKKIKESNTTCNTTIPYHPEKESKQSKYR